jgi:hypothetical protein
MMEYVSAHPGFMGVNVYTEVPGSEVVMKNGFQNP